MVLFVSKLSVIKIKKRERETAHNILRSVNTRLGTNEGRTALISCQREANITEVQLLSSHGEVMEK